MPWGNLVLWGDGPERIKALMDSESVLAKDDVIVDESGTYQTNRQSRS